MKKSIKIMLGLALLFFITDAFSQKSIQSLTFTAVNNITYVQLDSVKVMNRTQLCDTVLYWPDVVLVLDYLGLPEINNNAEGFQVFQNYPNPVTDKSTISLYIPDKDEVGILITDVLGRVVFTENRVMETGFHSFWFTPGSGNLFFFCAQWREKVSSIKILNAGSSTNRLARLEYMGGEPGSSKLKASNEIQKFKFSPGDTLLYIGYANALQSGRLDAPVTGQTYCFQFAYNIPCPVTPSITYEGQVYNTVQIFSQCWLKENLNVGTMIPGSEAMTNNGLIEKYCYTNKEDSCYKYGGLYNWDELMQYATQQGVQGICPPGWHLPTDEEWKVLEGAVDSQYGIGDPNWDIDGNRDYDAGLNLKNSNGWFFGYNGNNLFGFSGLPGGRLQYTGDFSHIGLNGMWWSSTEYNDNLAWFRRLFDQSDGAGRYSDFKDFSFSVRCLMNEIVIASPVVTTAGITNITQTSAIGGGNVTDEGSSPVTERGVCWSTTQNPTINDQHTSDGAGMGSFTSNLTGLISNTLYYVRAYATNSEGTAYGSDKNFTTAISSSFTCGDIVNYQGEDYNTVQIGNQCWFKENLNVGTMINGSNNQTNNSQKEKYCYDNNLSNCTTYGGLYQWDEMMQYTTLEGSQGICPTGWHIPSDGEWMILEGTVDSEYGLGNPIWEGTDWRGFDAGKNLKSINGWSNNGNGTDAFGFTGLPAGYRETDGTFGAVGVNTFYWVSTIGAAPEDGTNRHLNNNADGVFRSIWFDRPGGASIRCIKDEGGSSGEPCPGIPTVYYEGQTYNTVQIGNQCWFKENLNVGTMIPGSQEMADNSIIEKYCYNNDPANCATYGGLYQWNEMMQYTTQQGTQGICPNGWHLPTDDEWIILTDFLGGEGIAGGSLKEAGTEHWLPPNAGATNETGFSALPGANRHFNGTFGTIGYDGNWWSSTHSSPLEACHRRMGNYHNSVQKDYNYKTLGFSIRCIRDN